MKIINKYLITFVLILSTITVTAQGKFDVHVQFATMHYWRGLRVSEGPVMTTTVGYFSKSFSAFVFSGVSFTGNYTEVDPVINYTHKNFSITLLDVDNFSGLTPVNYFDYNRKTTNHFIDLSASYKFSFMDISWATILYGNDRIAATSKQRYSTYVEIGVPIKVKNFSVRPFIASAFTLSSEAETMLYSNNKGFSVVNVGFEVNKTLTFKKHSFPINATLGFNPALNQASVQVSINLF